MIHNYSSMALAIALFTASGSYGQVLFSENFEGVTPPALPSGWVVVDGADGVNNPDFQTVNDGGGTVLSQANAGLDTGAGSAATLGGFALIPGEYDSVLLDFDFRLGETFETNSAPDGGFVFGHQDSGQYYMVVLNGVDSNNEAFVVFDGGADGIPDGRTQIGSDFDFSAFGGTNPFVTIDPNTQAESLEYHDIQLMHSSSLGLIIITVDGETVFSGFDTTYSGGGVGFGAVNDSAFFDNVTVSSFLAGDADLDGTVDLATDFAVIRDNFKTAGNRSQGDLSGDSYVDHTDFRIWKTDFFAAGGSLEGVELSFLQTPEPTALLLGALGLAAAGACPARRR